MAVVVEPEDARGVGSSLTASCELQVSIEREIGNVGSVKDADGVRIVPDDTATATACRVVAEPTVTATSITVAVSPDGDCDGLTVRVDVYDQRWAIGAAGRVSDSAPAMRFGADNVGAGMEPGRSRLRPLLPIFTDSSGDHVRLANRLAGGLTVTSGDRSQPTLAQASNTAGAGEARTVVWAEDVIHAALVETESRLSWRFDQTTRVWGGTHRSFYREHSPFWELVGHSGGLVHRTGGTIESYYSWALGEWHSDGFPHPIFPDVDHTQIAYVYGYATGTHSCSMSYSWDGAGAYPNLHVHMSCLRTR